MGRRSRWTAESAKVVEELYEQGVGTKIISQRVKMSQRAVQIYINNHISEYLNEPWRPFEPVRRTVAAKAVERMEELSKIIDADCTLTLKQMSDQLPVHLRCSTRTISKALKGLELSRKRLRKIPIERNTPTNLAARKTYATFAWRKENSELYFLDETGFNLHNGPRFGYAARGIAPHTVLPGNRGQNVSVLVCIGVKGVIHWEHTAGAYNSEKFVRFLDNLIPLIEEDLDISTTQKDKFLIMDNAVIHRSNAVKLKLESLKQDYKFLPPYSPQLNPIEEFFSALKANQASIRPRPRTHDQLVASIEKAIEKTTQLDLKKFYQHMRHYLSIAKLGQPFV